MSDTEWQPLHDLSVAEAGLAECGGGILAQWRGKGQQHRFLACVSGVGPAGEGAAAEGRRLLGLLAVAVAALRRPRALMKCRRIGAIVGWWGLPQVCGCKCRRGILGSVA